jgi:hypothetical protein
MMHDTNFKLMRFLVTVLEDTVVTDRGDQPSLGNLFMVNYVNLLDEETAQMIISSTGDPVGRT